MAEPYKHSYSVDLNKPLKRFNSGNILASGDEKANHFEVTVCRGGENVDLSGCTVYGYFIRPNDETMKVNGTSEGNVVRVELPKSCYVYDGAFSFAVKVAGGGITQTVAVFEGRIVKTSSENIVDGDRVIYGVEDILAQIDAMEKAEADANAAASLAETAAGNANNAASSANSAAGRAEQATTGANTATENANNAAESINGMTVSAQTVEYGTGAGAELSKVDGKFHIVIKTERGQRGETGHGLDIKGTYATLEALGAAVSDPSQGDMYNVGTQTPYSIYMWQEGTGVWEYQGELQGETGAHYTPVITETDDAVTLGWENNGGLENPIAVNIRGKDGNDGKTPVRGTDYWTDEDKSTIVQDVLDSLPNASGVNF